MSCTIPEADVSQAFLASPPLISQTIIDLSQKYPNWLRDLYEVEEWPRGNGTLMEQLVFRGELPQIERGFDAWKKLANNTGCDACPGPDCSYNWSTLGGHAFDRKITQLMRREFRSPAYCISEIQTTAHFKEVFAKIIENLYRQIDFFKEMNIGLNFLTSLAKKFVVDSAGPKVNSQNPYVYQNIGTARLSNLNVTLLEFFYEYMRRMPDCVPFDVIDGAPIFSLVASNQLLAHMYRDDPNLRQDVRFSGLANDMLVKYNFMSTIRGMFIAAPVLYPRRFNIVGAAGTPVEVLPLVNGIPGEVGTFTGLNPAYEAATHEEVLMHGKYPFKVFTFPSEMTLGGNSSFGPEYSWFNAWSWVNPQTVQDPFRRVGYFATSAAIGLSQQYSEGIFAILVERPSVRSTAQFFAETECPPTPVTCNNEVPRVSCPCPLILSVTVDPVTPNSYFVTLAVPVDAEAQESIQLGLDTGGYVTGTVVAVSSDGKSIQFTLPASTPATACTHFTSIFCDDTLGCYSDVIGASDCRSGETGMVSLILKNPIKAVTPGDVINAYMGDGTTQELVVRGVSMETNTWVVQYNTGFGPTDNPTCAGPLTNCSADMLCDRSGVLGVCVPTATNASCTSCGKAPTITQCS